MLRWPLHSALTRLSVVPGVRTVAHLRHLQTPTAYYSQTIVLYNPYLHYRYARHYSIQPPQSSIASSSAPVQTTQAPVAPLPEQGDKSGVPAEPGPPLMSRVWTKVKHEASHYWHGTKLLASDIRISSRLLASLLRGKTLTRRERRQVRSISYASLGEPVAVLLAFHLPSMSTDEVNQTCRIIIFCLKGYFL